MTPENFAYWLQGFVELTDEVPTPEQWKSIKDHLNLVFNKVTPKINIPKLDPNIGNTVVPFDNDLIRRIVDSTKMVPQPNPKYPNHPYVGPQIIC